MFRGQVLLKDGPNHPAATRRRKASSLTKSWPRKQARHADLRGSSGRRMRDANTAHSGLGWVAVQRARSMSIARSATTHIALVNFRIDSRSAVSAGDTGTNLSKPAISLSCHCRSRASNAAGLSTPAKNSSSREYTYAQSPCSTMLESGPAKEPCTTSKSIQHYRPRWDFHE